MITENSPCLEVVGFGSLRKRSIDLKFYRELSIIDFHPFFSNFFEERDQRFGLEGAPRFIEEGNVIRYNFSITELAEAFFGKFPPLEFAGFLEKLLIKNDMSEDLIREINNFRDKYGIAFGTYVSSGNRYDCVGRIYFIPYNFPTEYMNKIIEEIIGENKLPKNRKLRDEYYLEHIQRRGYNLDSYSFSRPIFYWSSHSPFSKKRLTLFKRLKEYCLSLDKPIVFLFQGDNRINKLNLFEMIEHYNLDTTGLSIVRN